ncbi:MAG TPA: hypothetical protein PKA00_19840 [Saprospiraceae bacterium]|nr:hypothetical protein [Saprospiraceae bacterium]HMQ85172.1 hypothetical protein [Saprospiraceae bacterium]
MKAAIHSALCALFLSLSLTIVAAQDSTEQKKCLEVNGYVKQLQALYFFNKSYPVDAQGTLGDTFLLDNLVHHRLNTTFFLSPKIQLKADVRSRIFYGDIVKGNPDFANLIGDANNDYLDLSLIVWDNSGWVAHTMLDRLYLEYSYDQWEIRLGRQRINWGINTIWNPNDIFNAYNFTDFDYEERPGSDALRVKYFTGFASSLELAIAACDHIREARMAALWKFNWKNYDFQVLTGLASSDWVIGGGWAGNLGNAGFKGEAAYFIPFIDPDQRKEAFAATFGIDYSFSNTLYLQGGYLYNSLGSVSGDITGLFNFELSARNLYPFRHAVLLQSALPFSPLLSGSLVAIYSPIDSKALFINPSLSYSIRENWDLDLVGQLSFNQQEHYFSPLQAVFMRIKWSY